MDPLKLFIYTFVIVAVIAAVVWLIIPKDKK